MSERSVGRTVNKAVLGFVSQIDPKVSACITSHAQLGQTYMQYLRCSFYTPRDGRSLNLFVRPISGSLQTHMSFYTTQGLQALLARVPLLFLKSCGHLRREFCFVATGSRRKAVTTFSLSSMSSGATCETWYAVLYF